MNDVIFYGMLAILIPALFAVMYTVVCLIADEFKEGHKQLGITMIATLAVIVGAALPWYLL